MNEKVIVIDELSDAELDAQIMAFQQAKNARRLVKRQENIRQIEILAEEIGMRAQLFEKNTEALTATEAPAKPKRIIHPKYKHPDDERTWTGRGVAPLWVAEMEEKGITRESMLINKPDANEPAAKKGKKD